MTHTHPPSWETVFVPGYADVTAHMVDTLASLRSVKPYSHLSGDDFTNLVTGAREWLAKARAVESDAVSDTYALQTYKAYCDHARQNCYMARDVWRTCKGREMSDAQAQRRKDKPAAYETMVDMGEDRNDRVRKMHAGLKKAGDHDATKRVADEFNLSASQVRRIVKRA